MFYLWVFVLGWPVGPDAPTLYVPAEAVDAAAMLTK
jgi:hypothetical protein